MAPKLSLPAPRLAFRAPEWLLIVYFAYVAAIAPWFSGRPALGHRPTLNFLVVFAVLASLALGERFGNKAIFRTVRDWAPLVLMLFAFREMDLFTPPVNESTRFQRTWIAWDRLLLERWGFSRAIGQLGPLASGYLELSYLLVYATGAFCVAVLYIRRESFKVQTWTLIYLCGALPAYALFPFFPSQPPRLLFPLVAPPAHSPLRDFNLFILRHATIHAGVFPSAHVSGAFAAAFGLFLVLPQRKAYGWGLLIHACSVAVATVYGRYHYAADTAAGLAIGLIAGFLALALSRTGSWRPR